MEPKKANHRANVIRITEVFPHPDPETTSLELIKIDGFQLVVRKGQFKVGDLAIHIQPDSIVPQTEAFRFIWEGHIGVDGIVPERRRRITVRKFRKEWSEGLLLPITDFGASSIVEGGSFVSFREGDDVSDIIGIKHYDPDTAGPTQTAGTNSRGPKRKFKYPRTIKGWFKFLWFHITGRGREMTQDVPFSVPTYDVDALKNYKGTFVPGEDVLVTEKIHGSNGRFLFLDGVYYAGSRNLWKAEDSSCIWRKAYTQNPWIAAWLRANEGYALYGEVVPTQKGYTYGAAEGEVKFFWFDIRTPEQEWISVADYNELGVTDAIGEFMVPILYAGPYDEEKIATLVDGPSTVKGAKHIREGVVIKTARERTVRGLGRAQLKWVSNAFLEKDNK